MKRDAQAGLVHALLLVLAAATAVSVVDAVRPGTVPWTKHSSATSFEYSLLITIVINEVVRRTWRDGDNATILLMLRFVADPGVCCCTAVAAVAAVTAVLPSFRTRFAWLMCTQ